MDNEAVWTLKPLECVFSELSEDFVRVIVKQLTKEVIGENKMNLCTDCKHYHYEENGRWEMEKHKCLRSYNMSSLVTGECLGMELMCQNERYNTDPENNTRFCGEKGQYWKSKNADKLYYEE